jgi:acetolactate synthase-1/2/3 large subunit
MKPVEGVTGATEIARALKGLGIDRVFGLCSDQTNSLLFALRAQGISMIGSRHESGAVHMAEGWARATGKPAVAVVGGGPGFINSVTGMAVAQSAGAPVLVIAGQPKLVTRDRAGHQILYQADIVRSLTKWSQEVAHPRIAAEFVARGLRIACAGKPGPVFLSFPMDVMDGAVEGGASYRVSVERESYSAAAGAVPEAIAMLNQARRPVMVVGGGALWEQDRERVVTAARALGIPAFTYELGRGFLPDDGQTCFGYGHPTYNRTFRSVKSADLVVLVGAEMNTHSGEGKNAVFGPDVKVVQLHRDPEQIGVGRAADAAIVGPLASGLELLGQGLTPAARTAQAGWLQEVKATYVAQLAEWPGILRKTADGAGIHPLQVCASLGRHYTDRIRLSIDGGDFVQWPRAYFGAHRAGGWLDKSEMGSLGVGLPVAIGAQIGAPMDQTWVFIGDGGFGFNGLELSVAVEHKLPLKVFVGNDQGWGVERRLQLAHFGDTIAADLPEIRYDRLGEVLGARGFHVTDPARLDAVIDEAIAAPGPCVVDIGIRHRSGRPITLQSA